MAAVWTVVGLVQVADEGMRPGRLQWAVVTSVSWALATLLVLALALRFPLGRRHLWSRLALFAGLGFAVALVQDVVGDVAWDLFLRSRGERPGLLPEVASTFRDEMFEFQESELVIYCLVLGGSFLRGAWDRIRAQEVRALELESRLTEARLRALRMQLNPHFFFNALNTISGFIDSDPERARRVIARLGDLIRATLSDSTRAEVSLSEELELLDAYLAVVQARFGDRLEIEVNVEPGCEGAMVPELIFQPLVENAVRHGIEKTKGKGSLSVRVRRRGRWLVLEVADNGPGIGEDEPDEGVGLRSVRERLERLYGEDHSWELTSGHEGGLLARIELPFHTSEEVYAGR